MRFPWRKHESSVSFGGKLSAVVIRDDKPIKKRENLGVSWLGRLRAQIDHLLEGDP